MTEGKGRLPTDAQARKNAPIARGVLDYFPLAIAAIAELSRIGNEQHNPGQPMHWAREKSTDHADCIVRHLIDRGALDKDGMRHTTKVAWRALALLQTELEEAEKAASVEPLADRLPDFDERHRMQQTTRTAPTCAFQGGCWHRLVCLKGGGCLGKDSGRV